MKNLICLLLVFGIFSCGKKSTRTETIEDENLSQHQIDSILTDFKFEYDQPVFIDSTSQILLPITTVPLERSKKFSRLSSEDWYYSEDYSRYWNILFYNKDSGKTQLLTESKLRISEYIVNLKKTGVVLSKSILYKIRDTDYNKDKKLNHLDPEYLFISKTNGSVFKRLSPLHENLESYTLIPNRDQILLKTRRDSNNDLEFNWEDEQIWYVIDVSSDTKPVEIIDAAKRKKIENLYFEQWLKKKP